MGYEKDDFIQKHIMATYTKIINYYDGVDMMRMNRECVRPRCLHSQSAVRCNLPAVFRNCSRPQSSSYFHSISSCSAAYTSTLKFFQQYCKVLSRRRNAKLLWIVSSKIKKPALPIVAVLIFFFQLFVNLRNPFH